jgi:hypothetical protein
MAVLQTTVWRIRPGKTPDFVANITTAKKIVTRLGAEARLLTQAVGTNAPCSIFIIQTADWKAYGELQTKMAADSEWQGFFQKVVATNQNPAADLIGTGLSVEVPLG